MTKYFIGVDVGSSKTHATVVDENGHALGFGRGGPGNHEGVGYDGFMAAVRNAIDACLADTGISAAKLAGAGFGISGYDWPSERAVFTDLLKGLDLPCPLDMVNDACLGLLAGSTSGWGIAVVSGTGCNCWGWTDGRKQIGQVTGASTWMGEAAGAGELVSQAVKMVAYQWTKRGPVTGLTDAFIHYTGATSLDDLLEGLVNERYQLDASAAPLVFDCAHAGDAVAVDLIHWAGTELGELVKCVIRQLTLEESKFEVIQIGSLFDGGDMLTKPLRENVLQLAPGASFIRMEAPPVVGAAILGMEAAGLQPTDQVRRNIIATIANWN